MSTLSALTVAILLLYIQIEFVSAARILCLFINGIRSHLLVYSAVTRVLLERGHQLTLVTTLPLDYRYDDFINSSSQLRHLQLSFNYTNLTKAVSGDLFERLQQNYQSIEHTSGFLADPIWLQFMQEDQKYDLLLLGYHFNDYQLGIGAHYQCPVILIWPGQPISYIHSLLGNPELDLLIPQPYDKYERHGLISAWTLRLWKTFTEKIAQHVMRGIYEKYFPASLYSDYDTMRRNVSLVLCNHHSISEGPITSNVPGIIDIGGIQLEMQQQQNYLMDFDKFEHKDIIYLSLGTRIRWQRNIPETTVAHFVNAFERLSSYTILWTYDGISHYNNSSNIHYSNWWPQSQILAHQRTKLFITHGGKGSLIEAYHYGVPILGLPLMGDQYANVAKAVRKGIGLALDIHNITSLQLYDAIVTLLRSDSYTRQSKRFAQIYSDRPLNASATVAYWVDYVLRYHGAQHLQSPAIFLNFWQYYNLDVWALLLFTLLFLYVLDQYL